MSPRFRLLTSVVSVAVFFAAAAITVTLRPASYSAVAEIAVVPGGSGDQIQAADTISRGTVVDTLALVYGTERTRDAAIAESDVPALDASDVELTAIAVAGTSIIRIEAVSDDEQLSERVADAVANYDPELGGFSQAFRTEVVEAAAGSGAVAGPGKPLLYGASLLAALAVGVLVYIGLGFVHLGHRQTGTGPEPVQSHPGSSDGAASQVQPPSKQRV